MTGLQILGVLGAATALGAVAGGVVAVLGSNGDAGNGTDEALIERLDEFQARVNGLRDAVGESRGALRDVRERVVGVELELSRLAARTPAPAVPGSDGAAAPPTDAASVALGTLTEERAATDAAKAVRQALGQFKTDRWADVQQRFANAMKLRAMPEEQRWEKATEDLGLTSVQVDELRDAIADFGEARKAAISEEDTTVGDGVRTRFRRADPVKISAARKELDRRVDNTLNTEQKAAWNDKGYSTAFGTGGSRYLVGRAGSDGPGITVISTGIEIEAGGD